MLGRMMLIFILAAAVVAALLILQTGAPDLDAKISPPEGVRSYMYNAKYSVLDEQGALLYQLRSDKTLYYPNKSAELDNIRLNYRGDDRGPWQLTAPKGRIPPAEKEIYLTGGVEVTGELKSTGRVTLNTDTALARMDAETVETDDPVTITSPGRRTDAVGMKANLNSKQVLLENNVRTRIDP